VPEQSGADLDDLAGDAGGGADQFFQ